MYTTHSPNIGQEHCHTRGIVTCLYSVAALLVVLILVGGATRLTSSGLSITTWQPITGVIPPLSDADWVGLFEQYKLIPQYQLQFYDMTLEEYKVIYWWEWSHRMLARTVGLVYAIPLIVLALRKAVPRQLIPKLIVIFLLGALQGYIGWYMVQSGLTQRTEVSHYRLAVHFTLALLIYGSLLWVAWTAKVTPLNRVSTKLSPNSSSDSSICESTRSNKTNCVNDTIGVMNHLPTAVRTQAMILPLILLIAVSLQLTLGALVAGLRAGTMFNTWPLMDGKLIPDGLFTSAAGLTFWDDPLTVQWLHRTCAYVILVIIALAWLRVRSINSRVYTNSLKWVTLIAGIQVASGITTLLITNNLDLAIFHQAGGIALLTVVLAWNFKTSVLCQDNLTNLSERCN